MRPCQAILSKPRDGEVLLFYLKEKMHIWSVVLVQRARRKKYYWYYVNMKTRYMGLEKLAF